MERDNSRRIFTVAGYAVLVLGVGYLVLRYLLKPLLPFLFAWVVAMAVRPTVNRLCRRTKLPHKAVSFFAILFVLFLFFGTTVVLCERLVAELRSLSDDLMSDAAGAVGDFFDLGESVMERLPFLDHIEDPEAAERVKKSITSMIEDAIGRFSSAVPTALLDMVTAFPGVLLFAVVTVAATFYMGADVTSVNAFIARQLPASSRHYLFEAKAKLTDAGVKYVRAYLLLLTMTFAQLLIGFLILKIPYALTLAALIALIDILPVLGVGTVLVPWAILLLVRGDTYTGVGLLLMFGIIWIIRQISEPRIVGHSVGLSPLVTLIVMYAGYHFMGFGGLFVFPLVMILLKNLHDIGVLRLWRE
jgi:sporulation integral membrane protein YtvI